MADNLPEMVSRAGQRLLDAKTSAEVMEVKQMAEAALHYAKVTKAANDTHADCLRIITRAEIRMADEIDRAQANGEIAKHGQHGEDVQTSDNLGMDRRRVAEWREIRDAGEEKAEEAIERALSEGRMPTKADIRNHVRGTFGTGDNEWYTPIHYIELARKVLGTIDLDPASSLEAQKKVRAKTFFTKDDDGLSREWTGAVWLNPPYAQPHIADFVRKLTSEVSRGNVKEAILLTHNYTDTAWFQEAAEGAYSLCFTRGRVRFEGPNGEIAAPTQGQVFFYYGNNTALFEEVFWDVGFLAIPQWTMV